jgi:hypothetical protein
MNITTPAVTGDIILISQAKKNYNLVAQFLLRGKKAEHRHVAIALYNFSLIHAMPESGVHLVSLVKYLNENRDFVVFRNRYATTDDYPYLLEKYIRYYNLQGYSVFNYYIHSRRHSYCSELAAKAYEKSGLRLVEDKMKTRKVLPSDIYRHVSNHPDWLNITDEYKRFFFDNPNFGLLEKAADVEKFSVDFTQDMGHGQQKLSNTVNSLNSEEGNDEALLTPSMLYWSNNLANRSKLQSWISHFRFLISYWKEMIQYIWKSLLAKIK